MKFSGVLCQLNELRNFNIILSDSKFTLKDYFLLQEKNIFVSVYLYFKYLNLLNILSLENFIQSVLIIFTPSSLIPPDPEPLPYPPKIVSL